MSFRALGVLIRGLPPESLTQAAQWDAMTPQERAALPKPKGYGRWSHEASLLARIGDGVEWLVWAQTESAAKGGKPPKPYPRPGVEASRKQPVDAKVLDLWKRISESRGAVPA